jgi:acyl-CoA dehydrogenase
MKNGLTAKYSKGELVMDFELSSDHHLLSDAVSTFIEREIEPFEDEVELTGRVSPEMIEQIKQRSIEAGFYALNMPTEYGGGGLTHLERAVCEFQFGRSSRALHMICNRPAPILKACKDDQIESYLKPTIKGERLDCFALTEPGAGSDARSIITSAKQDGDDYIINGSKHFITQADRADFLILFAVTGVDETDRGPRKRITSFLVDKNIPGIEVTPMRTMSNRGLVSTVITLQDVRVPKRNILGAEGSGFNMAKEWIFSGRIMLAANCVGVSERAMNMAAKWCNTRKQFGKSIGEFQGTAFKLADMATEIQASRLMTLQGADALDKGTLTQRMASQINLYGSELAGRVTDNALQIFGGMGITEDLPIQRFWRDVRVERIWEGTSEIHRDIISRDILRETAD